MIGVPYTPEVDPTIAAEAFANGLLANLTANGGVGGGNLALTTQIVLQTTDGKVQLGSADDGNEVTFYADGTDFAAGTVKTRVFLTKGEVYVETGLTAGAIVTSTKGICGASGNGTGSGESPMPLGVEGFADRTFFLYAHRSANDPTGNPRGEVYVAAGAVSATVTLYEGDGVTVVDGPNTIAPFGLTILICNGNREYKVVADQPVFVGFAAQMGNPAFYDMRLVPPLATNLIGHARQCRLSALYPNTEVFMYAQNGAIGLVTLSPNSPIRVDNGTINELGDVFFIESNATPATAGTFTLTVNANTTGTIAYDATPQDVKDALLAIAGANSGTGDTVTATVGVSPVSIASVAHGLSTGDSVTITSAQYLALGHYSNVTVIDVDTFEIDFYPTGNGTGLVDWNQTIYGDGDFKVEAVKMANLGEASAKFVIYCKGVLSRVSATPSVDTTGLTGNAHTLTVYQLGTAVDAMPTPTDYDKSGIINAVATGPISGFSGADGSGLEATYWFPASAMTQRIPIPLGFASGGGNGSQRSIAVMSQHKGSAKLFRANGDLLMTFTFDRDAALATPDSSFEQRFPTGLTVSGNAGGGGIDQAFSGDWLGGYIEADVPVNIVLNTNNNDDLIQNGIPTNADEIICFGVTPESIRSRIVTTTSGRQRKQTVDESGTETWELV